MEKNAIQTQDRNLHVAIPAGVQRRKSLPCIYYFIMFYFIYSQLR